MTRKDEILEATLKLASEKGLKAVSMSQIASECGIQKASLYNHFQSKDQIIEELYVYLRTLAKDKVSDSPVNYSDIIENKSMVEILTYVVNSYSKLNSDSKMTTFYKVIMSERSINPKAAEIMVLETQTMLNATTQLFYVLQAKNIARFSNIESAALTFAMGVHAIDCYIKDQQLAGMEPDKSKMSDFIIEFCNVYEI